MKLSYEIDDTYTTGLNIGYVYALQEDYSTGHQWVEEQARRAASPSLQALGYLWKGYIEFWCGRLESAQASALICKELAESAGNSDLSARADWLHGWIETERGSFSHARECFASWHNSLPRGKMCEGACEFSNGLIDLHEGRMDSLAVKIVRLESHVASDDCPEREADHSLLGLLIKEKLLEEGFPEMALAHPVTIPRFATLVPPTNTIREPGDRGPRLSVLFMHSLDVNARAYARAGNSEEAIREYEKLIQQDTNRKLWIPPLFYYRLARLYDRTGFPDKANEMYDKFLRIWGGGEEDRSQPEWKYASERMGVQNIES